MGMYTELIFGAKFKKNTPDSVINTLRYWVGDTERSEGMESFEFRNPLHSASFYFGISTPVAVMNYDDIDNRWQLSSRSNIKNYGCDIELFLEWIKPYIEQGSGAREMYAIVIYEEADEPTIYYLEKGE